MFYVIEFVRNVLLLVRRLLARGCPSWAQYFFEKRVFCQHYVWHSDFCGTRNLVSTCRLILRRTIQAYVRVLLVSICCFSS